MQCRPDMFDVVCEDVCYESLSVHDFTRCRYCVPVVYKAHELVRDDDGLYYANAGQWSVTRHKEFARTRALPGPAGASRWAPPNPGPHDGPDGTDVGRSGAAASECARSEHSCQVARRTLDYTKIRYCGIAKVRMHIRLRLYKQE